MFKALASVDTDSPDPKSCNLKGSIPQWLSGSLIRNGPGQFQVGTDSMKHLFDGLAVLHRYNFKDGLVTYQNRFIESVDFQRCRKSHRIVATQFGTVGYPDPCKSIFTRHFSYYFQENSMPDNTLVNVMQMGDELYAMTETDTMMRIDPENLDTLGPVSYKKLLSLHGATAHTHQDRDGTTYNLASCYGLNCSYNVVKIAAAEKERSYHGTEMSILASIPTFHPHNPSYSHSFSITENYIVLIEMPLTLSIAKMMATKFCNISFKDALTFNPKEKARFNVVSKATGERHPVTYTADAFFVFHTINAYEDGGALVLDVTAYDDAAIIDALSLKRLIQSPSVEPFNTRRFVLPLRPDTTVAEGKNQVQLDDDCSASAVLVGENTVHCMPQVYDCGAELPRINYEYNGRKYRYFYGLDLGTRNQVTPGVHASLQLIKFDLDVQTMNIWDNDDPDLEPGEPVFVKAPSGQEEDDGVILSPVISGNPDKPSFLLVLDAATFQELGRAEIPAGIPVPYSFHGHFYTPQAQAQAQAQAQVQA